MKYKKDQPELLWENEYAMKCLGLKSVLLITCFLIVFREVHAQRYWVSTSSSNWNNSTNWSTTSGGTGGASVPGVGDVAIFDGGNNGMGNCVVDMPVTVNGILMTSYTGSIDLNGNTVTTTGDNTFSSGAIINSGGAAALQFAAAGNSLFNGTYFDVPVSGSSSDVLLSGSTFNRPVSLTKTGTSFIFGLGGNTFQNSVTLTNSGPGSLRTIGSNIFNGVVTVINSSASSGADILLELAAGSTYNDDVFFVNTGASNIQVAFKGSTHFKGNVTVSSSSGGGFYFSEDPAGSSDLAIGKNISIGGTGFTAGILSLKRFTQIGNMFQQLTLTGTGILSVGPSSAFGGDVNFKAPSLRLAGCAYSGSALLEKTGSSNDMSGGTNNFNGVTTIVNSGVGYLGLGVVGADTFNADLLVTNSGPAWISFSDVTSGTIFNGNIQVTSTSTGTISFGANGGASTLAVSKTIGIGGSGFSGNLILAGFVQNGGTAQSLALTGPSSLSIGPSSTFSGDVTFTAPDILLNGCVYNGQAYLEKNGTGFNMGLGNNTFQGLTTVVNNGSGFLRTKGGNVFNGTTKIINNGTSTSADIILEFQNGSTYNDVTFTNSGFSLIQAAFKGSSHFNGNVTVNSTSGSGIYFSDDVGGTCDLSGRLAIGNLGFSAGVLSLKRVVQNSLVAQSITLANNTILSVGPGCSFDGGVNFIAPQVFLNGAIYNGATTIQKNGSVDNACEGGNQFNGVTKLTLSSPYQWLLAKTTGDTFNGDVTFENLSGNIFYLAYNATSYFGGDITLSSAGVFTFGLGSGIVEMIGSIDQTLSKTVGSGVPVMRRLRMNKPSHSLLLATPVDIELTGDFTSGNIISTAANYINFVSGSSVSGGNSASFVDGPVLKTGNTAFSFPVGNGGVYRPLGISAPANNTDQFVAQYFHSNQPYGNLSTLNLPLVIISNCEYWNLSQSTGNSFVSVTISWDATDCPSPYITNLGTLRVSEWDGAHWTNQGNGGTTGTTSSGTVTSGAVLPIYGPITIGTITWDNPLPLELTAFDAVVSDDHVLLTWEMESEKSDAFFTVERATSSLNFVGLVEIAGHGVTNEKHQYSFLDTNPYDGVAYYRLKQTDNSGEKLFSEVKMVKFQLKGNLAIYPNPVEHVLTIVSQGSVTLYDSNGNHVLVTDDAEIDVSNLPNGLYFIRNSEGHSCMFLKK